jgi:hypothetical protein
MVVADARAEAAAFQEGVVSLCFLYAPPMPICLRMRVDFGRCVRNYFLSTSICYCDFARKQKCHFTHHSRAAMLLFRPDPTLPGIYRAAVSRYVPNRSAATTGVRQHATACRVAWRYSSSVMSGRL